jgi:transcription elongation factor GreB
MSLVAGFALDSQGMSKAFTKEGDGEEGLEPDLDSSADVPGGFTNYITPSGRQRLNDELTRLWKVERPRLVETITWAAGNGDRSENGDYIYGKRRLREIDRRIRFLSKRLDTAVVVDNAGKEHDRVYFGATVTVADESGSERTVSIVGVDELDPSAGRVSWLSPIATALMKASIGDVVTLRTPRGTEELEVIAIRYDPL